jgi:serine protease Do
MATILDPQTVVAPTALAEDMTATAEALRKVTVQVRGRGPGGGSGVIWQADGLIITNAHVARWQQGEVELWDGRVFTAEVLYRDDERDLAALKINATDLPAAPIGDSDALRVGEVVLAVGNPLGIIGALTTGIVHAAPLADATRGRNWVQADVRLAPGNSGGPLADAAGRVIGINSMIAGNLALAVPSNAVQRFLARGGKEERPMLGVALRPVTLAGNKTGLLIIAVVPDSAAEKAGLIIGDILMGANGQPFTTPEGLPIALRNASQGAALHLDISRGGQPQTITVTLAPNGTVAA